MKKKNSLTYRPIGEMEGRVRETNIFLRVASVPITTDVVGLNLDQGEVYNII